MTILSPAQVAQKSIETEEAIRTYTKSSVNVMSSFNYTLNKARAIAGDLVSKDNLIAVMAQTITTSFLTDIMPAKSNKLTSVINQYLRLLPADIREQKYKIKTDPEHNFNEVISTFFDDYLKHYDKLATDKLGIVFTPPEVIDFMNESGNDLVIKHFGAGLTTDKFMIIDPFTGTGNFLVRLILGDIIKDADIERKYRHEMFGNEILFQSYYIAKLNIESAYYTRTGKYEEFKGLKLIDTFEEYEGKHPTPQDSPKQLL